MTDNLQNMGDALLARKANTYYFEEPEEMTPEEGCTPGQVYNIDDTSFVLDLHPC